MVVIFNFSITVNLETLWQGDRGQARYFICAAWTTKWENTILKKMMVMR